MCDAILGLKTVKQFKDGGEKWNLKANGHTYTQRRLFSITQ